MDLPVGGTRDDPHGDHVIDPDVTQSVAPQAGRAARHRFALRSNDLRLVERASVLITELGADLDRRLTNEHRPAERLRMLRDTTNRITRTANDAVIAYGRVSRAIRQELARPDSDAVAAENARAQLDAARARILHALSQAASRYPPIDADATASPEAETTPPTQPEPPKEPDAS